MPLLLEIDVGEAVQVGDAIVRVERKSGTRVRLSIAAPRNVCITMVRDVQERAASTTKALERRERGQPRGKHPV